MKEFDHRKEANKNMEFITPKKVREWLSFKVHSKFKILKTVFDPAVGSGQLFQFINSEKYIGCDVSEKSLKCFEENFKNVVAIHSSYFNMVEKIDYDIAVSNYPFSLNAKDLFNVPPVGLEKFYNKEITGKADFAFILKSFLESKHGGFYLCFPGITYRSQESKFRDFLIENNYVESFGILKNCEFDATNIDVFYLELSKNRKNNFIVTFTFDFNNDNNNITKTIECERLKGESWKSPEIEPVIEKINIKNIEKEIKFLKNKRRKNEDELDKFIKKTFKFKEEEKNNTLF